MQKINVTDSTWHILRLHFLWRVSETRNRSTESDDEQGQVVRLQNTFFKNDRQESNVVLLVVAAVDFSKYRAPTLKVSQSREAAVKKKRRIFEDEVWYSPMWLIS